MKPPQTGALMCAFFMAGAISIFAQGSLTPPAAPTPTMKSLDQIEARTPISSVPFPINSSGSYYLTKNLSVTTGNAITITTSNVSLDLNGFTISSTQSPAGSGYGILLTSGASLTNISISHGAISSAVTVSGGSYSGNGFAHGISYSGPAPTTARVSGVTVSGCLVHGIYLGTASTVVEFCSVDTAGGNGITATSVSHSTALNCGSFAILANNVSDSFGTTASGGGSGYGIYAATATNCYGSASGSGNGIYATTTTNCWGENVGATSVADGLHASVAENCRGTTVGGGSAVRAHTASGCYGTVSNGSAIAIWADESVTNCNGSGGSQGIFTSGAATNSYGSGSSYGIQSGTAVGCYGVGGNYGISCLVALGSYGVTNAGTGINASTASFCAAYGNPVAISADVGTGCYPLHGVNSFSHPYNTQ